MKNLILTLIVAFISVFSVINTNIENKPQSINRIEVSVPCKVHCISANTSNIKVKADSKYVYYEVKDSVLYIKPAKFIRSADIHTANTPVIYIYSDKHLNIAPSTSLCVVERNSTNTELAKSNEYTKSI